MKKAKKTNITDRLRAAWRALRGKPVDTLTIGIEARRCSECDYYKQATTPAETTQAEPPNRYWHEITYLDNVVLVVLYEATETGPVELARHHGHILHKGAKGIAQATGYAMKRIWEQMKEGTT